MPKTRLVKGCKVTDRARSKVVGIACSSLNQLEEKAKTKLNLVGSLVVALEDGTVVDDDYFNTIPPHTLFICYRANEQIITGVDLILNALKNVNATFLTVGAEAAQLLHEKAGELTQMLEKVDGINLGGNTPDTDPDWFENLETNATSKEDYMYRKAQDRIRGYLYKCQDDIRKLDAYGSDKEVREVLSDCIAQFKRKLSANGYFGCYFDRRCASRDVVDSSSKTSKKLKLMVKIEDFAGQSYCDSTGKFQCEGLWKLNYCEYNKTHSINPYANRESRIIFSTWNLDHRIEKSRTIVPAMVAAAKQKSGTINVDYFFSLLFTRTNLRLVHIVCHDKGSHKIFCDEDLYFLPVQG